MDNVRTVLTWTYEPVDYFEAPYTDTTPDGEGKISIFNGSATVELRTPVDPISDQQVKQITAFICDIFSVRQLLNHRPYSLRGLSIAQHNSSGSVSRTVLLEGQVMAMSTIRADIMVTNAAGQVVHDTKAERIKQHKETNMSLTKKMDQTPLLRELVRSYSAAVNDPENEMVHLYQILDTLKAHYGSEKKAQQCLPVKAEWKTLEKIANHEPIDQSRHRGSHIETRRPATDQELQDARSAARAIIEALAKTI
jgi:hypothetical protein